MIYVPLPNVLIDLPEPLPARWRALSSPVENGEAILTRRNALRFFTARGEVAEGRRGFLQIEKSTFSE
jgi:hypothetical protein